MNRKQKSDALVRYALYGEEPLEGLLPYTREISLERVLNRALEKAGTNTTFKGCTFINCYFYFGK